MAAGVWCPFRALLRVPPILFRFFCCFVPYVMYVAELRGLSWAYPLASGGLLLCGVVLRVVGGLVAFVGVLCLWVGWVCGCLGAYLFCA